MTPIEWVAVGLTGVTLLLSLALVMIAAAHVHVVRTVERELRDDDDDESEPTRLEWERSALATVSDPHRSPGLSGPGVFFGIQCQTCRHPHTSHIVLNRDKRGACVIPECGCAGYVPPADLV